MKLILKSIGAVLAGFVTVALLSVLTDFLLESVGILPPASNPELTQPWMLVLALVYRSFFTVLGGYVAAKLAPKKPMKHVIALMILGGLGGLAGVIGGWSLGNQWYPILLALTGPLFVYLGGTWQIKK